MRRIRKLLLVGSGVTLVALASVAAAIAGAQAIRGTVQSDGSSTVAPFAQAAAESFEGKYGGARVVVGVSGTGGGFERFCKNETDLSNASRPIRLSEAARCHDAGVGYIQFLVANDGISVVVNRQNTWANCLTTAELKKIWDRGSNVDNWNDVRSSFPNVPLKLYGPGTDSGTFEFFTEKINGRARQSRSDYSASEDDNVLVRGVAGDRGAMGYFGLSYYLENRNRLKVLRVNGGNGCVTPSVATVQSRAYRPLSRGLFIYSKKKSFKRDVVAAFIRHIIVNEKAISRKAKIVPLTKPQLRKAQRQYNTAIKNRKNY
ncbi:MAG TPA: PstS family phosphate ABC transporter substrate-binding protein [Gaiellaceae bacterium]|nr:PstS family phosphate ABC transporter substrate-binding protein [Gaiellaceae bacterium]